MLPLRHGLRQTRSVAGCLKFDKLVETQLAKQKGLEKKKKKGDKESPEDAKKKAEEEKNGNDNKKK